MRGQWIRCVLVIGLVVNLETGHAREPKNGWQTFRSADYGFTIDYPADMTFYSSHPVETPELSMFPLCAYTVACFQYNGTAFDHTSMQAVGVSVNVLRGVKTEAECDAIDTRSASVKTIDIHGAKFVVIEDDEVGGGSGSTSTMHRTFYQHVCFDVTIASAYTNLTAADDDAITQEVDPHEMKRIFGEMDRMLHSFRFVGPVKDGADWTVYSDDGCGQTFEYPSGATVRKVTEYSRSASNSLKISCEEAVTYKGLTYRVAVKVNLKDLDAFDGWLSSSGYPDLKQVRLVAQGNRFTKSSDQTFTYIFDGRSGFIFTVSDENHKLIPTNGNRVFAHLLGTFTAR